MNNQKINYPESLSYTKTSSVYDNYGAILRLYHKHLNGDYTLRRSYWVHALFVSFVAPRIGIIFIPILTNLQARYISSIFLALTGLGLWLYAWALVGTWRSASNHTSRGGLSGWAAATKFVIILNVFFQIGNLINPQNGVYAHLRVARGVQPGKENTLTLDLKNNSIKISGGMNDGVSDLLDEKLTLNPSIKTIVLNSEGGWLREGVLVAKIVSKYNLSTQAEILCASSCTVAFIAGKDRYIKANTKLGFHRVRTIEGDDGIKSQDQLRDIYRKAGVKEAFIDKVMTIPSGDMWYPTQNELAEASVITRFDEESSKISDKNSDERFEVEHGVVFTEDNKKLNTLNAEQIAFIKKSISEANKNYPIMTDKDTRLDNQIFADNLIHGKFTLVNVPNAKRKVPIELVNQLREFLVNSYCTDQTNKILRDLNIGRVAEYSALNQEHLFSITMDLKDCEK
jgi:hypothetical protein